VNRIRKTLAAVAVSLAALALPGAALADHTQTSVMQDDQYLVDSSTPTVESTLGIFRALGVQVIRVNMLWDQIAPDPLSRSRPANFDATDPAAYPAAGWAPYDRLAQLAPLYGMRVEFDVTAPGPLWAMGSHPPTTRAANHWRPSALEFLRFVFAAGKRYSGSDGQAAVHLWSIWNEPDQPGWLAPQSLKLHGREVAQSPRMYRSLADAAYFGLYFSGHARDTILIGETAPEGYDQTAGFYTALTPMPFLRDLYCVGANLRPLQGAAAQRVGCSKRRSSQRRFAKSNPILFDATGFAHHPYYFFHAPGYSAPDPNFIPIADLGRLERFLDGTFRSYGARRRMPIYFTEYGYQTRPPDPYEVVTPAEQAAYLNEADYLAWRNPRVRSVAQFLLYDAAPDHRYRPGQFGYWDTFQTGLLFAGGHPKPALFSYRIPIWLPQTHVRRGTRTFVWGQVRLAFALGRQRASIQWRPSGRAKYRVLASVRTNASGFLAARVRLPGSGFVRLEWRAPGGIAEHSRIVPVLVR
jgi:hypothetical protein